MDTLFGFSMDSIMHVMLASFLAITVVVGFLAWRNQLFLRIGLRNIPRRRTQSILIVIGLMLGTVIVTTAFAAGDTFSYSIRASGVANLGAVDETVTGKITAGERSLRDQAPPVAFLPASTVGRIESGTGSRNAVDGVTGILAQWTPLQDLDTRQTKANVVLEGVPAGYPAAFGPLLTTAGQTVSLSRLDANGVYVNQLAAQDLNARVGNRLRVFVGGQPVSVTIRGVLQTRNLAAGGLLVDDLQSHPAVLLPLDRAQELTGHPGQITHVLVSNRGDALTGASVTKVVKRELQQLLGPGYNVNPIKQRELDIADGAGSEFTAGFVAFGLFSIVAGVMLIFLIFVMLAAERRSEMGMARAVGTKRRHLIQQFLFEGYVYDLGAAIAGVILGIAVGLGMVTVIASLAQSAGFFDLQQHIEPRSVVVAFCVGAIITFGTVVVSSWRVSRLSIVAAIRDLPDDERGGSSVAAAFLRPWTDLRLAGRRLRGGHLRGGLSSLLGAPWHLILAFRVFISRGPLLLLAGYAVYALGSSTKQAFPFELGISLLLVGSAMLLRWILSGLHVPARIRDRLCYSLAGIALVVFWLLPFDFFRSDLQIGVEMFVLAGVMLTLGGVWTVMWNIDLLLGVLLRLGGGVGRIAPVLKMAVTYPTQHRFRMGMTLFMFSLVVFAIMVQAVLIGTFGSQKLDLNRAIGGYNVYGTINPNNPIGDVSARISADSSLRGRITAAGGIAQIPISLRQARWRWQNDVADIAGDPYLASTHFTLHARARGYAGDRQVWQMVRTHPGYAVINSDLLEQTGAQRGPYLIRGFTYADRLFKPTRIELHDLRSNTVVHLTVIGVVDQSATNNFDAVAAAVFTSRATLLAAHDAPPAPTIYFFRVAPGQSVHRAALAVGSAFLANGLDVHEVQAEYDKQLSLAVGFNNLLEGFMALGLIVGIAALGVIATRSVVERRQQIGVLRAIGFRRRMVQVSFLLESGFVAVLGTLVGVALGLLLAHQLVAYFGKNDPTLHMVVPWPEVGLILMVAYLASLLTTYLPAWQASRVYPAEALRYE